MSEIYFPLQSNAHSLLTGAPVESVRRRLKSGFLFYHEVYLEAGTTEIFAGPNGSVSSSHFDERAVWQTPKSRAKAIGTAVWINIRPDGSPGPFRTVMHSPVSISWKATLLPFREEILGIDGIAFVTPPQLPTELRTVAASRARDDERNDSLKDRLPVEFVRSQVIGAANNDLVVASLLWRRCKHGSVARQSSGIALRRSELDARSSSIDCAVPLSSALPCVVGGPGQPKIDG